MPRLSRAASFAAAVVGTVAIVLVPASVRAQARCGAGSFQQYIGLGATGCRIGAVRVSAASIPPGAPTSYAARATFTPFTQVLGGNQTLVGFDIVWDAPLALPNAARPNSNLTTWLGSLDLSALGGTFVAAHVGAMNYAFVRDTLPPNGFMFVETSLTAAEIGQPSGPPSSVAVRRIPSLGVPGCVVPMQCVENGTATFTPRTALRATIMGAAMGPTPTVAASTGASVALSGVRVGVIVAGAPVVTTPEPGTMALVGVGLAGAVWSSRRRRTLRRTITTAQGDR